MGYLRLLQIRNAAIADQNLRKLRITSEAQTESASSSRLSMQHLNIFKQENDSELLDRYIQLIPLTPDTSFRMTAGAGIKEERALIRMSAGITIIAIILNTHPQMNETGGIYV